MDGSLGSQETNDIGLFWFEGLPTFCRAMCLGILRALDIAAETIPGQILCFQANLLALQILYLFLLGFYKFDSLPTHMAHFDGAGVDDMKKAAKTCFCQLAF